MTSNVEWICGGDNVGQSVNDTSSPYHGTIPVPPVMCAQLEALTYSHILRPLRREVLSSLRELMTSNEVQNWFTAYLSIFVICHSCSLTTRRDEQFAQRMGYSVSSYICLHATRPLIHQSQDLQMVHKLPDIIMVF